MAAVSDPALTARAASGGAPEVEERLGQLVAEHYRIVRHIRSGGSSHVFEAEHLKLGRRYAVKLLRPELVSSERMTERIQREARALGRLRSEHVVNVVDFGTLADRTPFLVLELLEGEDLRSLLDREGKLAAPRAVRLAIDACHGLAEAHSTGLVHRDLKPENLFVVRRSNGEDSCKLLDFGVAKSVDSRVTAPGALVGTVRYIAPEQLLNASHVGPATDIYALGAILYECLTGKPAHPGEGLEQLMYSVLHCTPEPLDAHERHVPRSLAALVSRCLERRPEVRPASARELARLLRSAIAAEGPSTDRHALTQDATDPSAVAARCASRQSSWRALGFGATALGGLAVGFAVGSARPAAPMIAAREAPAPSLHESRVGAPPAVPSAVAVGAPLAPQAAETERRSPPPAPPAASTVTAPKTAKPAPSQAVVVGQIDEANPYRE
jgi:serine/threonine-protein kinase